MLSVKINVLSSDYPVASATPMPHVRCVGLIRQYHYVGLDKISVEGTTISEANVQSQTLIPLTLKQQTMP